MLEDSKKLLIKAIEEYGLNDEATLACSILVDKILNKEGGVK